MQNRFRPFILLIAIILFTNTLSAEKKLYLWEVQSDSATVYLMGSIHIGQKYIYPLDTIIEDAFEKSDNLVLEIDIINIDPEVMMKFMDYMMIKDSSKLNELISKESFDYLLNKISPFGIDENMLNSLRPWYAYFTAEMIGIMNVGSEEQSEIDSLQTAPGIEQHFAAKAGDRKMLYLETIEDQFKVLMKFDDKVDQLISHSIKTEASDEIQLTDLVRWWNNGNDEELLKQFKAEYDVDGFDDIMLELFDKRNIKMTTKINEYLDTPGTYFVIVGAGHLIGKNSIVDILESQARYIIERK